VSSELLAVMGPAVTATRLMAPAEAGSTTPGETMPDRVERGSWSAFAVEQLLRADACPICEAERRAGNNRLDMLLYENVNDPGVRAALRASAGWCGYQLGRAMDIQLAAALGGQTLDEAFEQTGPVCLTHISLVRALPPGRGRDRLLERTVGALTELAGDLKDYFARHSHDYHGDTGDRGALGRLAPVVRGSYPGATANQCRAQDVRIPWYRKLLRSMADGGGS